MIRMRTASATPPSLHPVAAFGHAAPCAGAVFRPIVKRPPAVVCSACFEALPVAGAHRIVDADQNRGNRKVDAFPRRNQLRAAPAQGQPERALRRVGFERTPGFDRIAVTGVRKRRFPECLSKPAQAIEVVRKAGARQPFRRAPFRQAIGPLQAVSPGAETGGIQEPPHQVQCARSYLTHARSISPAKRLDKLL